ADMLPLHEAIPLAAQQLEPEAFRRWKSGLVVEVARLARFLHDRRCFHKDLYLCHFFIARSDIGLPPHPQPLSPEGRAEPGREPPQSWRGRVHLIDFHRLGKHRWTWPVWRVKDLGQLLYSSHIEGVDGRDRLRFWRHYLGQGKRRPLLLTWCVRFKGRRYHQHNAKLAKRMK
ncbi:MAG: hypothetical protein HY040_24285, partial [Planctomycetes bacterium]|nr:hypothetical protein [Planctomycetota bacterium]